MNIPQHPPEQQQRQLRVDNYCYKVSHFINFAGLAFMYLWHHNIWLFHDVHLIIKVLHCNLRDWINHHFIASFHFIRASNIQLTYYQFENERKYFFRLFLENSLPEFVHQTAGQVEDVWSDVVDAATRN